MLDQTTRNKIDSLRDILVGKIPDPKAQVDQITTALIYKFMDDMDAESMEMGGRASYFLDNFSRYSWSKVMDRSLSGQERFELYSEALNDLPNNEKLPDIFRTVFKNAFLPYRDVETLNLFLKEINEFQYEHSENLGNAFEYLLSILGSQGDAGQFRTPRHIIDFIVAVLDPQKEESVLDPACGTAGFLISAYKHVLKHNSANYDSSKAIHTFASQEKDAFSIQSQSNGLYKGEKLNPDQRTKLQNNIVGYDISPDMVKLSMVNMYLHRFVNPNIYEYDTLTHDSRWDDNFDVILANPPFMSPKGGIRPHSRFSVSSNRSEVLFVDYIAEHLSINGRAGIIVPEGIIFKADKAYKALRKMMVEDHFLWAVVSMPAGIFKPYSGVKTSILFFDKQKAKANDEILFVDVQADGFNLGDTRQKIKENDLPEAFQILGAYAKGQKLEKNSKAHCVSKKRIAKEGDYNLSGNRYKNSETLHAKYPLIELGDEDFFEILSGNTPPTKVPEYWRGNIPCITIADLDKTKITEVSTAKKLITPLGLENTSAKLTPPDSVLLSTRATIGIIAINKIPLVTDRGFKNIVIRQKDKLLTHFLAYVLLGKIDEMKAKSMGLTFKEIPKDNLKTIKIPLPPVEIQKKIVTEIENYQKIIDGARQIIDNWKPSIKVKLEWPLVQLGELCEIFNGSTPSRKEWEILGKWLCALVYYSRHARTRTHYHKNWISK